jgi:hypothetical protein
MYVIKENDMHALMYRSITVRPILTSLSILFLLLIAILRDTETEQGFDYKQCARLTDGYTPSDITGTFIEYAYAYVYICLFLYIYM